jgi:hypothetical protein
MEHPTVSAGERREHERVPLRAEVVVLVAGGQNGDPEHMAAHNVSMGGAFLETTLYDHIHYKTGARLEVTLLVDEDLPMHAADEGHTIHVQARIVRRDPGGTDRPSGLGVMFERLDLENLAKLCALVHRGQ